MNPIMASSRVGSLFVGANEREKNCTFSEGNWRLHVLQEGTALWLSH
jgi:hypothetical protein